MRPFTGCPALIAGHGGFHYYRCGKPTKASRVITSGLGRGTVVDVCGIHLRAHGLYCDVIGKKQADDAN